MVKRIPCSLDLKIASSLRLSILRNSYLGCLFINFAILLCIRFVKITKQFTLKCFNPMHIDLAKFEIFNPCILD